MEDDDGDYESMEMEPTIPPLDTAIAHDDVVDKEEEKEEEEEEVKDNVEDAVEKPTAAIPSFPVVDGFRKHAGKSFGGKSNMVMKIANRHRRNEQPAKSLLDGITNPAIRRLARTAGIKRIAGDMYVGLRKHIDVFMNDIARDAVITMQHKNVMTCTTDILRYVLERNDNTVYGYGH